MAIGSQEAGRPDWVDRSLFPFTSRFVMIQGHSVHYIDEGHGPVLLFAHGNPTWSFVYRDVIRSLSSHFRCVSLDYPGFGLSRAQDDYLSTPAEHASVMAEFIELLHLDRYILVAQDWGGPIGLSAALRAPERLQGLVLGNTWAWPVNGDLHFEIFSRVMGGAIGRMLIMRFNMFVNLMIPAGHRRRKLTEPEMRHYKLALDTPMRRRASAIFPRSITSCRDFLESVDRGLQRIEHLPSLLVWGDRDIAFRRKELRRWEQRLVQHTTVVVEGAGHYVQSDAPDEFARAIRRWHLGI